MAYSAEVLKRARARLAEAKADRESENRQHMEEAYIRVPRLREIDKQLRLTMAMAALASGKPEDSARRYEQMRQYICRTEPEFQSWLDVYRILEVTQKYTGFHID